MNIADVAAGVNSGIAKALLPISMNATLQETSRKTFRELMAIESGLLDRMTPSITSNQVQLMSSKDRYNLSCDLVTLFV
jgi:hypothetical protein